MRIRGIVILIFFCSHQMIFANSQLDNEWHHYNHYRSFIYLYDSNIKQVFSLYESEIWDDALVKSRLEASLRLLIGKIQLLKMYLKKTSSKIPFEKVLNLYQSYKTLTEIFIKGIESDKSHWKKNFLNQHRQLSLQLRENLGIIE